MRATVKRETTSSEFCQSRDGFVVSVLKHLETPAKIKLDAALVTLDVAAAGLLLPSLWSVQHLNVPFK